MSLTTPCCRAICPRIALRNTSCWRYMTTETVSATPPTPVVIPPSALSTKAPPSIKRSWKNIPAKFSRAEKTWRDMHPWVKVRPAEGRGLNSYKRYIAARKTKTIDRKWIPTLYKKGVSRVMSHNRGIPIFIPPTSNIKKTCPEPVNAVMASQIALLDPTGARTRLFSRENPERACVGDILLVRQRTGDPFAGVCINIKRRGVDTSILLRGQLTRVGIEMWYKVYSPLVEGIEVVQRATKRARRARLTYMRTEKHDRGSVENIVRLYMRQKAALGTSGGQRKTGAAKAAAMMGGKKKKGKGKKR